MRTFSWMLSVVGTSAVALIAAFYVTSGIMSRSFAQNGKSTLPTKNNEGPAKLMAPAKQAAPSKQAAPTQPTAPEVVNTNPVQATAETPDMAEEIVIRDPFRPFREFRPADAKLENRSKEKDSTMDPLQNLDLNSVELTAVLWDVPKPRALIKASDGTLYTIMKNTKLGRNGGTVAGIREGEVIVLETYEEDGKVFRNYVSLKMPIDLKKKVTSR